MDQSVRPNETSSGSSESWHWHLPSWKDLSPVWYTPARHSFRTASWTVFPFQHLFSCLPIASSWVPFSGHSLWPLPCYRLARVRQHLSRCVNNARRPAYRSMLYDCVIDIDHTYRSLTILVSTRLRDGIYDAERGFHPVETGLPLQAGTGSYPASPSHSIKKLPHMTYFLVWGHGKQAQITRLDCTCPAIRASSWSGESTSGGGQACRSALWGGGWALGVRSWSREYVNTRWILGDHGATTVWHWLPWCSHYWAFYMGCDPTGGLACQEGHNLKVGSLDTRARNQHAARDDVLGCYTLGKLEAMLLKPVCNAWSWHLHRKPSHSCSQRWQYGSRWDAGVPGRALMSAPLRLFACFLSSSFWGILLFLMGIGSRATIMTLCIEGIWRIIEDRLPIVIYAVHPVLSPTQFERCVLSDMKI